MPKTLPVPQAWPAQPAGERTPAAILVTRPEPGGAETGSRLISLGWRPVLAPALVLTPRAFTLPPAQAVLLTSRAAARALPPPVPGLPLLAVGEATAEAARGRGWTDVAAAAGTAEDMAGRAAFRFAPGAGPLVLAVGQGYALDLAAALRTRGFRVIRRIAYAATPASQLPDEAAQTLRAQPLRAVLFHSPRSAACAITLLRTGGFAATLARTEALAISSRVAAAASAALAPLAFAGLRVAARPEEASLLALLGPGPHLGTSGPNPSGET
jgi:uroporphyrinogen-III synthase